MSTLSRTDVRTHLLSDALRRHKVLILVVTLLLTGAVAALASTRAPSYTSTARMLLRPTLGNPFSSDSGSSATQVTIAMQTEAEVVDSSAVATLSNKKLTNHWSPGTGVVVATVLPNTQILQVAYTANSAANAQKGAKAVAAAYLTYRKTRTATTQKSRLDILNKQVKSVKTTLASASKAASASNAPPEASQQVQLYSNQLVTLQTTIGTLEATGADPGSIVSPAALPAQASSLNPLLLILSGALLGLLAGILLAIWREREDDRVRGASDTSVGGIPVLGHLSAGSALAFGAKRRNTESSRREVIQRVRTATLAAAPAPAAVAVADVSDAAKDGGAADVAVELASALRRSGYRVTLVDAGGDGRLERSLGLGATPGLSEALTGQAATPLLVEESGLKVLTGGGDLAGSAELMAGARFGQVITELRQGADYVVVLAAPAATPSGIGVGRATDGLLVVGQDKRSTHDDFADIVTRAGQLDVPILGAVLMPGSRASSTPAASRRGSDSSDGSAVPVSVDAQRPAGSTATSVNAATPGAASVSSAADGEPPVLEPSSSSRGGSTARQ